MDATIKRLREQGRRKPMEIINADQGARGTIALVPVAGGCELRLSGAGPQPAILHQPTLTTLHGDTMLFLGLEYSPGRHCPRAGMVGAGQAGPVAGRTVRGRQWCSEGAFRFRVTDVLTTEKAMLRSLLNR
jgi:hypothetical protein